MNATTQGHPLDLFGVLYIAGSFVVLAIGYYFAGMRPALAQVCPLCGSTGWARCDRKLHERHDQKMTSEVARGNLRG